MPSITTVVCSLLVGAVAALGGSAEASDLAPRGSDSGQNDTVRFTSFDWCRRGGSYPKNVMPESYPYEDNKRGGLVFPNRPIKLTWENAMPGKPVELRFYIGGIIRQKIDPGYWSKNVTQGETSYEVEMEDILDNFSHTWKDDETSCAVRGGWLYVTSDTANSFWISQIGDWPDDISPTELQVGHQTDPHVTCPFKVIPNLANELETYDRHGAWRSKKLRERSEQRWRLGVGTGVGIGVPILMALAFLCGRRSGKKAAIKKGSEQKS